MQHPVIGEQMELFIIHIKDKGIILVIISITVENLQEMFLKSKILN